MNIVFLDFIPWDFDVETPLHRPLGGSQSAMCYLATALARRGHRVSLVNHIAQPRRVANVDCHSLGNLPATVLGSCDAAIVLNGPGDHGARLRSHLSKNALLILWTQHAHDQPAMTSLAQPEIRGSWDYIVCISDWHRHMMTQTYALDPNRTAVLRNAISPRFENLFADQADLARNKSGVCTLAYTSTPFRGLQPLTDIFPDVHREFPATELRIYSSMQVYQVSAEQDQHRVLYEKCQTTPGIRYVGSVSQTRLAEELKTASFLAYPNTFPETSCIAVMEALAAGMHVVSSHLGALPETGLGFATLVTTTDIRTHEEFLERHRRQLLESVRFRELYPEAFVAQLWRQVQTVNRVGTWQVRAEEWEQILSKMMQAKTGTQNLSIEQALQLGWQHLQQGQAGVAENLCRQIHAHQAGHVPTLELWANSLQQLGRVTEAAEVWENLGLVLAEAKQLQPAQIAYRQALALDPHRVASWNNLGKILQEDEKYAEAEPMYLQALKLAPHEAQIATNLGNVYASQDRLAEAEQMHRRALSLNPNHAAAWNNLGTICKRQLRYVEAEQAYRRALDLAPDQAPTAYNLGNVCYHLDRLGDAEKAYRQALQHQPSMREAIMGLSTVLETQGILGPAEELSRGLLRDHPDYVLAEASLANVLKSQGRVEEAWDMYLRVHAKLPDNAVLASSVLQTANYVPGMTLAQLETMHADWDRRFRKPFAKNWPNDRDPDRPLRIGFVSGDFRFHPVGRCLVPVLQQMPPGEAEVFLYANQHYRDEVTDLLKASAHGWRDVPLKTDDELETLIRGDRIDVLVDLSGHTAGNRIAVFTRKPAPVQITWFGYVGSTGLSAIDYLIADRHHIVPGTEARFREKILLMPHTYAAYAPLVNPGVVVTAENLLRESTPINALPCLKSGVFTFASFSNPAKINSAVAEVWSRILSRVPDSRLLLKFWGYEDVRTQDQCRLRFTERGIAGERIVFSGKSQPREMLAHYNQVDLALDPFPYSGGMTTSEALWMGVPVIACPGEVFCSRHASSYLRTVGLDEMIADDFEQYEALAVSWANRRKELAELRSKLRERMWNSPLCGAAQFAKDWIGLVRQAWRETRW